MNVLALALALIARPDDGLAKKMLPILTREAEAYSIAAEADPKKPLELRKDLVYEWSNPTPKGDMHGAVFLWLRDGRAAAFGCIFSQPHDAPAGHQIVHEMHALDPDPLVVTRPPGSLNEWTPRAGLRRKPVPNAPAPAATAAVRLVQMRRLAQEFAAHGVDRDNNRSEFRLLPTPLYRYPEAKAGVTDGGLFAFVDTSGTDPEVLLVIEARERDGKPTWEYACGRFSDRDLHARHKQTEVWSMVRGDANTFNNDPQHLYSACAEKVVGPDGKLLARCKATPQVPWGVVYPVTDK